MIIMDGSSGDGGGSFNAIWWPREVNISSKNIKKYNISIFCLKKDVGSRDSIHSRLGVGVMGVEGGGGLRSAT